MASDIIKTFSTTQGESGGIAIRVTLNMAKLNKKLDRVRQAFATEPLLNAIGQRQHAWVIQNFESAGGNVGGWVPLASSTILRRRKGSSAPLQDTGRLRMSIQPEVQGNKLTIGTGTNVSYASYHQTGVGPFSGKSGKGKTTFQHPGIPQRRFLPTAEEFRDLAMRLINAKVEMLRAEKD